MMENDDFVNEGMEERARYFEQMLESGDTFFYDNDELGQLIDYYLDFEQIQKATVAIEFGESLYPFETNYKIKKAEVYIAQRNINGGIKLLEKYRTIEPNNGEIAKLLGDCYALSLQYKRALECYLFALNQDQDNDELLIRLARINFALGNNNKAMSYLNAFPKNFSYDEVSIHELIRLFLDYNQYNDAIQFLKKVIDENPYNYGAWYFTGLINQKQDKNEQGIDAYEFCIAIEENNTMGHLGKGNCLMELDRFEEAIESFKLSLDNDESDAEVYCNVAECYENLKDDNAAKYYYLKSIKINPNISDAYFGLGTVYKRALQWKEAERYLLKSIDIDQYESLYHIELAEVYLIQENSAHCYKHYQQAYDIDSDTTEILLDFAHAKFEMGDIEDSVQLLLENLEDHDEDHRIYYRIASYSFTLGHFENGYNFLHAALGINSKAHILLFEFSPFTENMKNITNIIDLHTK